MLWGSHDTGGIGAVVQNGEIRFHTVVWSDFKAMNLIYVSIFHTPLNLLAPRIYPQLLKGCSQGPRSASSEGSTIP